jgi:hypothetical protein
VREYLGYILFLVSIAAVVVFILAVHRDEKRRRGELIARIITRRMGEGIQLSPGIQGDGTPTPPVIRKPD